MNLFADFSMYNLVGIAMAILGLVLFEVTTKNKEFKLIFEGNVAAALSLGGRFYALTVVLQAAATNSVSLMDMVIWGSIGIVALVILFYVMEVIAFVFAKITKLSISITSAVDNNNYAVGIIIALVSIGIANIIAGNLTYDPTLIQ